MKTIRKLLLFALALSLCSCARSPSFDVRLVDSATGAPIGGAEVGRYTTTPVWMVPDYIDSNTYLGETDERGMFSVDPLDMDSSHRITFVRVGYINTYIFVTIIDDEVVYWISTQLGKVTKGAPLAGVSRIEAPMLRGRETAKKTPYFSPTRDAWWEEEEE